MKEILEKPRLLQKANKELNRFVRRFKGGQLPDGLIPISKTLPEDVFIVGYPKSGNTWFQTLVSAIVYGVSPELAPPLLLHGELVPDVHFKKHYQRYATPMFFKSHHMPRPEYRRVVYLLRDGRDAMVSYFHYLQALNPKINFLDLVENGRDLFPGRWHEHVEAWLANPYKAQMLPIRYEALKKDPVKEMQRFCEFMGLNRDEKFLRAMTEAAGFDKMHEKERRLGWESLGPGWPKDKFFIRRGAVGSYRDEMPADVLESFMNQATDTLRRLDYI